MPGHLAAVREREPDAAAVAQAIAEKWIEIRSVRSRPPKRWKGLHRGEREALLLAKELKCPLLIDDSQGRLLAKLEAVACRGTLYVLLWALRQGQMDLDRYLRLLDSLVRSGFRLAEGLYILPSGSDAKSQNEGVCDEVRANRWMSLWQGPIFPWDAEGLGSLVYRE
jgi:predicted nucleic acid-binding protein